MQGSLGASLTDQDSQRLHSQGVSVMANASTGRWLRSALLLAVVGAAPPFASETAAQVFSGTIAVNPPVIHAGDATTVTYLVRNDSAGPFFDLAVVIRLVGPGPGA